MGTPGEDGISLVAIPLVGTGVSRASHTRHQNEKPLSVLAYHTLPVGTDSVPKMPTHESPLHVPSTDPYVGDGGREGMARVSGGSGQSGEACIGWEKEGVI
jgi:hypothetical protein